MTERKLKRNVKRNIERKVTVVIQTPGEYLDFVPKVLALCPSTRFLVDAIDICMFLEGFR